MINYLSKSQILIVVIFISILTTTKAASEPITGYKKAPFGATMSEVKRAMPSADWDCETSRGSNLCSTKNSGIAGFDQLAVWLINEKVVKTAMTTDSVNSNIELISLWEKYRDIFKEKYGKPNSITETMIYPYDDTRSEFIKHGATALNTGSALFGATWSDKSEGPNVNGIVVMLKPGWVQISYESKEWGDYMDKRNSAEEAQF